MAAIFTTLVLALFAGIADAAAHTPASSLSALHRRASEHVAIACYAPAAVGAPCACPIDLNGDYGVLINYYPGYQCAYAGGACTWADDTGALQNTEQTNCPISAPCPSSGCSCPTDLNDDSGVLINQFKGYQCAYTGGACTWDFGGELQNTEQTNCPTEARCLA